MQWTKILAPVLSICLMLSMHVQAESVDQVLTRVTIAVDGMMKSKSGAT